MKRWYWCWCIAAVLFSWSPPIMADDKGWGLMLTSPRLGIIYIYLTDAGFAIVYPKTGAKFVTHAPDWQVVAYNDVSKTYYVEPSSKAIKSKQHLSSGAPRQGGTAVIAAQPVTQYFVSTQSDEGPKQAQTWITTAIKPPAQLKLLLGKIFQADMSNFPEGMPLKVNFTDSTGQSKNYFDTLTAQRQNIKRASFNFPANYKRVDNELAVCIDAKSRLKMEELLKDADILDSLLTPTTKARKL